ncbi:MAG: imidazolonepropionase [Bacteroidota bacterium]
MAEIHSLNNAYLLVEDGCIAAFGPMAECPTTMHPVTDINGGWVLPGFVDSHTHMVFASSRHMEFVMRLQGKTYEDIAAEGGGILNSAKKLQSMSQQELYDKAYQYALNAINSGTTALEIKSGYGLSTDAELKMLRVIKMLKEQLPITVKSTFLGAHAFPTEFKQNHQGYIDILINEMLPAIAEENLADFIDVFCDKGFYSTEETALILNAGKQYGLRAKIHGNELGLTGGVQIAVANNALSVDHLEHLSNVEIECLLESATMPVILPGSSFFLKIPYAPGRQMIDAGLPVAIASDFNPGSSPHYNLWFTWSLACLYNGLLPAEAFNALTINAAYALGISDTHGSISVGKKACLIQTRAFDSMNEMPYWFAQNHAQKVWY